MRYDLDQLKDMTGDVADEVKNVVKAAAHMTLREQNDLDQHRDEELDDFTRD